MFSAEQLTSAVIDVLRRRGVRITKDHLRIDSVQGNARIGLPLTAEGAVPPSEAEWQRLTAEMAPAPPLPATDVMLWGHATLAAFARDGQPSLNFFLVATRGEEVVRRAIGNGSNDAPGLRTAIEQALRVLGHPIFERTMWLEAGESSR